MSYHETESRLYNTIADRRRHLVGPLARLLSNRGISPDLLSIVKLIAGVIAVLLLRSHFSLALLLLTVSLLIDFLDGGVASLHERKNEWGVFVDIGTDWLLYAAFVIEAALQYFAPYWVCAVLLVVSLLQWGLGALWISSIVSRPTCQMGVLRQSPRYVFVLVSLFEPAWLETAGAMCGAVMSVDCAFLVWKTRGILKGWPG